jgi:subfamily B ATP-binding cassette protein HlyB/CyaB
MDTGLNTLIAIARIHQISAKPEQIAHQFGQPGRPFTDSELLRAAKALTLKAEQLTTSLNEIDSSVLPAMAKLKDGSYVILVRISEPDSPGDHQSQEQSGVLVQDLREKSVKSMEMEVFNTTWSGELILLSRGEDQRRKLDFAWFIPSLVKYRKLFAEVLIASLFLQLFALAAPLIFQVVMDNVLIHRSLSSLDVLALSFLVLVIFYALMGSTRNYLFSHTTNRVDITLGSRLYKHLMALPIAFFESFQVGQTVARVRELETIRNFITGTALIQVIDLIFVFIFLAVMWYYSPTLTWIVLATLPLYVVLSIFITPILQQRLKDKLKHGAANTAVLTESIIGIGTIKSMVVESQIQRKLEEHLVNYVHASFRSQNLNNVANQVAGLINKLMILSIIWWGAHLVIANELTVGQLLAFTMLAGLVSSPILKLVQLWQDFQLASISLERMSDILNTPREPGYNPNRYRLPALKGEVTLEHIRFRYRSDGPLILDDLSLRCRPGEVIGIVGRSGSGKSTIAKLIQRLYIPESGRVLIDGIDLSMIDTVWLRQQVGVVRQENFLFNRTIGENIALANPALPEKLIINAAKLAGAHGFILNLPEGYDTLVGEQGSNLSSSQRQRIAIARALISHPRILIFDEATSSLDYESERLIQDNMETISRGCTVIIIAHRLSNVRQCDRIIVLDKGHIAEQGDHQGLLKANGYYAKLYHYQNHTPGLSKMSKRKETQYSAKKTNNTNMDKGKMDITIKRKTDSRLGVISNTTEIEEVDESWAIELLEALEKEERENKNRAGLSKE